MDFVIARTYDDGTTKVLVTTGRPIRGSVWSSNHNDATRYTLKGACDLSSKISKRENINWAFESLPGIRVMKIGSLMWNRLFNLEPEPFVPDREPTDQDMINWGIAVSEGYESPSGFGLQILYPETGELGEAPDYWNSLDACSEFERKMTSEQHTLYAIAILNLFKAKADESGDGDKYDAVRRAITASSQDRCRAYLKSRNTKLGRNHQPIEP